MTTRVSQPVSVRTARRRLLEAIGAALTSNREAMWANGYRAHCEATTANADETKRLWDKEQKQWRAAESCQAKVKKALAVYAAALRQEQ